MPELPSAPDWVQRQLREGMVIPAHPLALDSQRRFDERRQIALSRYYHAAGAGGVAVGVHTTQFEIRQHGLFEPVLKTAVATLAECDAATGRRTVCIAGVCGRTPQAVREARWARSSGFHIGLLSLAALRDATEEELIEHSGTVAAEMPLMGFYLQPAVGGRVLSRAFWRRFVEIPNVVAIKVAPFNRYQTLDVVRAVAESGRSREVALYTGNDDQIVGDLTSEWRVATPSGETVLGFTGGLLGHWACWTRAAVTLLQQCKAARQAGSISVALTALGQAVTDCNAAFFDAAHGFAGCIAGIHEVLRRQGLLEHIHCLDPAEGLSPGQAAEIDRVYREYPHLNDDAFVREHLAGWLR